MDQKLCCPQSSHHLPSSRIPSRLICCAFCRCFHTYQHQCIKTPCSSPLTLLQTIISSVLSFLFACIKLMTVSEMPQTNQTHLSLLWSSDSLSAQFAVSFGTFSAVSSGITKPDKVQLGTTQCLWNKSKFLLCVFFPSFRSFFLSFFFAMVI